MNYSNHMSGLEFTKLRMEKGLSQAQIANILGVSLVTVKSWEHERRNIPLSINNFLRLSIALVPGEKLIQLAGRLAREYEKQRGA